MPPAHPPEFRARAIELARERAKPLGQIARDLGISESCLRGWVAQADIDQGRREGLTTDEHAELVKLRRENRTLAMEIEILKRAAADSTGQCNICSRIVAGVRKARVLRGRELSFAATTSRSSWVSPAIVVPFGKY
jgi:transposase